MVHNGAVTAFLCTKVYSARQQHPTELKHTRNHTGCRLYTACYATYKNTAGTKYPQLKQAGVCDVFKDQLCAYKQQMQPENE